jgi:hypothetical protein
MKERTGMTPIRVDTSNSRREMNHDIRPYVIEKFARGSRIGQVDVPRTRYDDTLRAPCSESSDDMNTEKTSTAGNDDRLFGKVFGHGKARLRRKLAFGEYHCDDAIARVE